MIETLAQLSTSIPDMLIVETRFPLGTVRTLETVVYIRLTRSPGDPMTCQQVALLCRISDDLGFDVECVVGDLCLQNDLIESDVIFTRRRRA